MNNFSNLSRRKFLKLSSAIGAALTAGPMFPLFAKDGRGYAAPSDASLGPIELTIDGSVIDIAGRSTLATTINGTVPGPLVRLREGTEAVIRVSNRMREDTSIHWHGLILPFRMDGVPGLSYDGIQPGETFEYRFPVRQHGTYWYHSHTGLQEQTGLYGPVIIDPQEPAPWAYDREFVIMLSDWSSMDPHLLLSKLKKQADYSNYQQQTLGDFLRDVREKGFKLTAEDRLMWSRMRMMPTDIADVTGHHYTYLLNGRDPESNWTGLFQPGERIRLRIINAAAGTYFDFRIPGLPMTVVQADGQNVAPVEVDELRVAIAETYDVIVSPDSTRAYTLFAESMDRSGYARGTLTPQVGMASPVPSMRQPPLLTMRDMGMAMGDMAGMAGMDDHGAMPEAKGASDMSSMQGMEHGTHSGTIKAAAPDPHAGHAGAMPGMGAGDEPKDEVYRHNSDHHGPGNVSVATESRSRLHERGTGLDDAPWRVLVYTDLRAPGPGVDQRPPRREIELHLTGNMERYMWSFDGEQFSERTEPIRLVYGERVRLTFVNDTMMNHPIHLHGMWMVLENGNGMHNPRKHTINVKPAERLSADVTVDAPGNWAFHCHILFHMEMGMFRVVSVSRPVSAESLS